MEILLNVIKIICNIIKYINKLMSGYSDIKSNIGILQWSKIKKNLKRTSKYYLDFMYADRVIVVIFNKDLDKIEYTHETVRQNNKCFKKSFDTISTEKFQEYVKLLSNDELVMYMDVNKECENYLIKEHFVSRDVKSAMMVSITKQSKMIGFVIVEYGKQYHIDLESFNKNIKKLYCLLGSVKEIVRG